LAVRFPLVSGPILVGHFVADVYILGLRQAKCDLQGYAWDTFNSNAERESYIFADHVTITLFTNIAEIAGDHPLPELLIPQ